MADFEGEFCGAFRVHEEGKGMTLGWIEGTQILLDFRAVVWFIPLSRESGLHLLKSGQAVVQN